MSYLVPVPHFLSLKSYTLVRINVKVAVPAKCTLPLGKEKKISTFLPLFLLEFALIYVFLYSFLWNKSGKKG